MATDVINRGGDATGVQRTSIIYRAWARGFSVIELLIVLVIFGVLAGIASWGLTSLRKREAVDSSVFTLQQDINRIRTEATKDGDSHRLTVVSSTQYALARQVGGTWVTQSTKTLNDGVAFVAPYSSYAVEFDSRGYATFSPAGLTFHVSDGTMTKSVMPAMSGISRVW